MDELNNLNTGINLSITNGELLIKGNEEDLNELVEYIERIITSKNANDHIHLNEETLISNNSEIKELIIEKSNN